jgi:glycine/D-amino acid oxidase-like deaminating enzyme
MSAPQYSNYWLDTVNFPSREASSLPSHVDAAVVGAGYCGLSAALELAKRGAKVAVFESASVGWGASSRNGGMVLTGTKLPVDILLQRYGRETARTLFTASLSAIDFVENCVREYAIDCGFTRAGHLEVACKQAHFDAYRRGADLLAREFGHSVEIVRRDGLAAEIGSGLYFGGMVDPLSAGINPARYVAGLARAAREAGAQIFEHTPVQGVEGGAVRTARGAVKAEHIFAATGAYTGSVTPELQRRIIPLGSFIVVTERLQQSLAAELIPRGRMIYDSLHLLHYFRLTSDHRLLFGGRAAFFPESPGTLRRSVEILARDMVRTYPQLRGVKIEYAWGGTLDLCFDSMPHSGVIDGYHFAAGYAGHGVAMASWMGAQTARRICREKTDDPFFEIACPVAPRFVYGGRPWFLPFAGAWYRVLDWIH